MYTADEPREWQAFGRRCTECKVPLWLTVSVLKKMPREAAADFFLGMREGTPQADLDFNWPTPPPKGWQLIVLIGQETELPQPIGFDYMHESYGELWSSQAMQPPCHQFDDYQDGWADLEPDFFRMMGIRVLTVEAYKSILEKLTQQWA